MKAFTLIFCFVIFHAHCSIGQTMGSNHKLSSVIDSLYAADQSTAKIKPADSAAAAYQRVIRTNFPTVKKILDTYGYPNFTLVGQESSDHYFTLVQHSDFNQDFQQRVLKIMRREVDNKNASGKQYAFLTDRIATTKGDPQVYGTQVLMSGNSKVKPCISPAELNKRRKSVGLEPIEDYLKKCNEAFYEMNPQERNKAVIK
ncbi:DUF6624 domain-containing protein [Hymenobacter coccineus]|uniref:DUF6624 domain-containing protein n=1 Tax=Hymenobacter coccineus TaxID=1908235 RepID=UPI000F783F93|nr:DUF6624 domain-containing protein [Hymenobacter coccineus]